MKKFKKKIHIFFNLIPNGYKIPYLFIRFVAFFDNLLFKNKTLDQVVFVHKKSNWILDRICIEVKKQCLIPTIFYSSVEKIPRSKSYFFSHYNNFFKAILRNPHILRSKNTVFFTHPKNIGISDDELAYILNLATSVIVMNSSVKEWLLFLGVRSDKLHILYAGVDDDFFYPINRKNNFPKIGFCLGYGERDSYFSRKNYSMIIDIIKKIDFANVIIIGRDWANYSRFNEIKDLSNFTYVEIPYEEYSKYYKKMDVFVSVSKLEGGPVPLLEAMFCNVFPVVSNTGFASDVIVNEKNGFIFDTDATLEDILVLIKKAIKKDKKHIAQSVKHLTWKNFGIKVCELL